MLHFAARVLLKSIFRVIVGINLQVLQENKGNVFTQHLLLLIWKWQKKNQLKGQLIIPIDFSLIGVDLSLVFVTPLYSNYATPSHPAVHLLPMITVRIDIPEFHKV